jgi:phage tail tube protein FII
LEPTPWLSNFGGFICIVNEQGARISEAWDGVNLQFTFRRTFNRETMEQWQELVQIANSINLSDEECDRTTSKMRGLSPKIISGDSRRSENAQTHTQISIQYQI